MCLSLQALAALAQQSAPVPSTAPQAVVATTNPVIATTIPPAAGFSIRGVIHSGNTKLPGVTVTAAHSLTGRKVITSTDIDGSFRLDVPSKGRWVLRAEFSAFAVQTAELMLTPALPDATHDFELVLLSRVPKTTNDQGDATSQGGSRLQGSAASSKRGAQTLTLSVDDAALAQSATAGEGDIASSNVSGLAASADATNQSVSVSGRMGNAQDFGLQNMDELHDRIEEFRSRGQWAGRSSITAEVARRAVQASARVAQAARRWWSHANGIADRPHGQIYYNASNAALDAAPYSLSGPAEKPAYGSNKIGAMVGGPLKIPHVYDDGGKTFIFMNYSGTRSSTPYECFRMCRRSRSVTAISVDDKWRLGAVVQSQTGDPWSTARWTWTS